MLFFLLPKAQSTDLPVLIGHPVKLAERRQRASGLGGVSQEARWVKGVRKLGAPAQPAQCPSCTGKPRRTHPPQPQQAHVRAALGHHCGEGRTRPLCKGGTVASSKNGSLDISGCTCSSGALAHPHQGVESAFSPLNLVGLCLSR